MAASLFSTTREAPMSILLKAEAITTRFSIGVGYFSAILLLLLVALQALTLLEFVARRSLADQQQEIAGLVPGNPKRKTDRPTAERMLGTFTNLHLVVETDETEVKGYLNETLTPLQQQILALLDLPETIFDLSFTVPLLQFQ